MSRRPFQTESRLGLGRSRPAVAALLAMILIVFTPAFRIRRALACAGPCNTAAVNGVATYQGELIVEANFGLIRPTESGWQVVCEEAMGGLLLGLSFTELGIIASTTGGVHSLESADGCGWQLDHEGSSNDWFRDFAVPNTSDGKPHYRFGLSIDAENQDIHVERAAPGEAFEIVLTREESGFDRLVAGGDPAAVYTTGYTYEPLMWNVVFSLDDGDSWEHVETGFDRIDGSMEPFAVDPYNPNWMYTVLVGNQVTPDELWRFDATSGKLVQIHAFDEGYVFGGLLIAEDILYLAGHDDAQGRLFRAERSETVSFELLQDGGPRYSCLGELDGDLLACVNDFTRGSDFIVGRSADAGKHWEPVLTIADLGVSTGCGERCSATTAWLYSSFGVLDPTLGQGFGDAGVPSLPGRPSSEDEPAVSEGEPEPEAPGKSKSGCAVALGAGHDDTETGLRFGLLSLLLVIRRRMRRSCC